jgi:DNA ligase (NAD+)
VLNGITKPSDLFQLTEDDYQEMGFGPKQSENFVKSLKNSLAKEMPDVRFVASWGVDNLGKGEAKKLLEQMSLPDLMIATEDQIISIHGFAEKSANDIVMGIANNIAEIQKLISLNFNLSITKTNSDKSKLNLYGKLFVFTGKVNTSRKLLKQMAEENGGIVQSGVNKKTTILVAGENAGSKLKKAQDLGVLIITEEEFLKMV